MDIEDLPEIQMQERFAKAVKYLSLNSREIAVLLGVSEATISRNKRDFLIISRKRAKIWEIASIYVEVVENLERIYSKQRKGKMWFFTYSHQLGTLPIECLKSFERLLALHKCVLDKLAEKMVSKYETFTYS